MAQHTSALGSKRSARRVVIIGAGTSGCVLARRISENPDNDVLLFEEGHWLSRPDLTAHPPELGSLADAFRLSSSKRWAAQRWAAQRWAAQEPSDAHEHSEDRKSLITGMVVGGSGRINGGYFIRPTDSDLASWDAAVSCPSANGEAAGGQRDSRGFNIENLKDALKRAERDSDFGRQPHHGNSGPIPVERDTDPIHPVSEAFQAAAATTGFIEHPDLNDFGGHGIGPVPFNAESGLRVDASLAYLWPIMRRPNVTLLSGVRVARVAIERGRAVGVTVQSYARQDESVFVPADEVIVAAGALGTPRLLFRSGLGPADALRRQGKNVAIDCAALGSRFWNHPCIDLQYRPTPELCNDRISSPSGRVPSFMQMVLHTEARAGHEVDAEFMATRRSYGRATNIDPADQLLSLRITPTGLQATGAIEPSRHHARRVRVAQDFAGSDVDRSELRMAVRLGVALLASSQFGRVVAEAFGPQVSEMGSDRNLDEWIEAHISTTFHMSGSAPMGADPATSVVDRNFVVHGLENLRIVDASVIPVPLSRGPAATVIGLAEVASAIIS